MIWLHCLLEDSEMNCLRHPAHFFTFTVQLPWNICSWNPWCPHRVVLCVYKSTVDRDVLTEGSSRVPRILSWAAGASPARSGAPATPRLLCPARGDGAAPSTARCAMIAGKLKQCKSCASENQHTIAVLETLTINILFAFQNAALEGVSPWRSCCACLRESTKRSLKCKHVRNEVPLNQGNFDIGTWVRGGKRATNLKRGVDGGSGGMNFNVWLPLDGKEEMTRTVLVQPRKLGKNEWVVEAVDDSQEAIQWRYKFSQQAEVVT